MIEIAGSKHAALHILGALWLVDGSMVLRNVPRISDVKNMVQIYRALGMSCSFVGRDLNVNIVPSRFRYDENALAIASRLRSSILLLGGLLVRSQHVRFPIPKGDPIGERPIDEFLEVLDFFGIAHAEDRHFITATINKTLEGNRTIDLKCSGNNRSALAIILAAANDGKTTLLNPLPQPEILELCSFLNDFVCPVCVEWKSARYFSITVKGRRGSGGVPVGSSYAIGPDKCEMGFWIVAASVTRGRIVCKVPTRCLFVDALGPLSGVVGSLLEPLGISLDVTGEDTFVVDGYRFDPRPMNLVVPTDDELVSGLAIDVCPQFIPVLALAHGASSYTDRKYGRARILPFFDGLQALGVVGKLCEETLNIRGHSILRGAIVRGHDIRGAATLLLASLAADGMTLLDGALHLGRGYDRLCGKLRELNAEIIPLELSPNESTFDQ